MPLPIRVSERLDVSVGRISVPLTPRQGLQLAEELTRKSFAAAMTEEAERHHSAPRLAAGIVPKLRG